MQITGIDAREAQQAWARQIKEVVGQLGDADAVAGIDAAVEQLKSNRFVLAILGKAKRGKSTLLNAMIGRRDDLVAPIDKLPASSAISRFSWADREQATVYFRDGRKLPIRFEHIRDYVTEERNRENVKEVELVEISGPFSELDRDLVLVDTPGAGSIHEYHDQLLHAFIPQADAVVFLVTARMPLDQDELDLLAKLRAADIQKVFFAINRVDESNEEDLKNAIAHNASLLSQAGVSIDQIYGISAKRAFQGSLKDSGVLELTEGIARFLRDNKNRTITSHFRARVLQLAAPTVQLLALEQATFGRSASELAADVSRLETSRRAIEQERPLLEREFRIRWEGAVDQFEQSLSAVRRSVDASIQAQLDQSSLARVGTLSKSLPSTISAVVEEQLAARSQQLEREIREAASKLEASYPAVDVSGTGDIVLRAGKGSELAIASLGGATLVAVGGSLATAASATATSIAAANALALASTTTVAVPSTLGSLLSGCFSYFGLNSVASTVAAAGTGTATVAAPGALTATPLWVVLGGPIGWSLAGIGVLAVPFAWRLAKLREKDKIESAARKHVAEIFRHIQSERLPALRKMGQGLLEEFRLGLDRQLARIEGALSDVRDRRLNPEQRSERERLGAALRALLDDAPGFSGG